MRAAWADVDLSAVAHNVAEMRRRAAPARLCAVVKADGYGHGAVEVARAALAAGADLLAVALVEEGVVLRDAGVDAPVLVLSQPSPDDFDEVVAHRLTPIVDTLAGIAAAAAAVRRSGGQPLGVHLKVDTGMHRVGAAPDDVVACGEAIAAAPALRLDGCCTHLAVADEPGHPLTDIQLGRFTAAVAGLDVAGVSPPLLHAANSAATLAVPRAHYDLVRCGITLYGLAPSPALAEVADLRPALSVRAAVSHVARVPAGEAVSYGQRYRLDRTSTIATVPVGYADGVPRALGASGVEVLLGGRRRPIAGTVTMDQLMVDCGDDAVRPGDEVVLLGRQGAETISVEEWAHAAGTITYEIVCGFGARLRRRYRG